MPYAVYYLPMAYFLTGRLYLLIPFTYYVHSIPFHFNNYLFVLCFYESVSFCFVFWVSHISEIIWYLSFFCVTYFTKHNIF